MKLDCYAVLGLSPTAEDAVIRAAYLALMRTYHPDRNGTPEAAARARTITEAYKMIGDPARRAEYDAGRTAHMYEILGYEPEAEREPQLWRKTPAIQWPKLPVIQWPKLPVLQWPRPPVIGAVAASALAVVVAVMALPMIQREQADVPFRTTESSSESAESTEEAATTPKTEAKRPLGTATSAPARPSETSAAPAASTPSEKPLPAPSEPARALANEPIPAVDAPPKPKRSAELSAPPPTGQNAPKPAPVDEKARVAALEWQSTSFYNQSVNHADGTKRLQLQQARDLFVTSRNACRSDSCVGDAHVSYMRDISRIMQKPKAADP